MIAELRIAKSAEGQTTSTALNTSHSMRSIDIQRGRGGRRRYSRRLLPRRGYHLRCHRLPHEESRNPECTIVQGPGFVCHRGGRCCCCRSKKYCPYRRQRHSRCGHFGRVRPNCSMRLLCMGKALIAVSDSSINFVHKYGYALLFRLAEEIL